MAGIFRSQTQQMPMTARPFSQPVIKRKTTTATAPIDRDSPAAPVINISGYSTVRGYAQQGITPRTGKLRANEGNSSSGATSSTLRSTGRGLMR